LCFLSSNGTLWKVFFDLIFAENPCTTAFDCIVFTRIVEFDYVRVICLPRRTLLQWNLRPWGCLLVMVIPSSVEEEDDRGVTTLPNPPIDLSYVRRVPETIIRVGESWIFFRFENRRQFPFHPIWGSYLSKLTPSGLWIPEEDSRFQVPGIFSRSLPCVYCTVLLSERSWLKYVLTSQIYQ
jgi:hypothetical protein